MSQSAAVLNTGTRQDSSGLGVLIFVSLLVMLNLPLFFTLNTGMDLYGFYTVGPVAAYPLPLVLSTLLSSGLAVAGYGCYRWLWRRRAWLTGSSWGPFTRGAILSGVPVLLAYAPSIILTSHGGKPGLIVVAGLMGGALCVTHALRDPETRLDRNLAVHWFIGTIAAILVFLALSIGGMLVLYFVEQQPASGNLLWKWEYAWSDLGYPREQFPQRQRDALVGFTLTGSGFMIVALGGSMLGAVLRWTREPQPVVEQLVTGPRNDGFPAWVGEIAQQLRSAGPLAPDETQYVAVFDGYQIDVAASQYEGLVADKDDLLRDVELMVNKASGNVSVRIEGQWRNLDFRVGAQPGGRKSGPFSLLGIYVRNPGRRFANADLRVMLARELGRSPNSINVGDFIGQLQRRKPPLPVHRDEAGTYIPDTVRVCLLELRDDPNDNGLTNGEATVPAASGY